MKKSAIFTAIALFLLALPSRAQINLLHEFAGGSDDGTFPGGSLILSGTTLYGMTGWGGDNDKGTIFKIQYDGSGFALLHEFPSGAGDGYYPFGSLILSGSTLYGMTNYGGNYDKGTVFKIQTDGSGFALLHEFAGGAADGASPRGSLILSGTTLYGMTQYGGDSNMGTVFKIQTNGSGFILLHEFAGGAADGAYPYDSLILSDTTLYGMTENGGNSDYGAIFKIETDGCSFALLHGFAGGADDGAYPKGSLILSGSTLCGLTSHGGDGDCGTIFKIAANGSGFALLHEFAGSADDGTFPWGSLTLSGSVLYGTTIHGGANYFDGTIFKIQTDGSGFALLHSFAGGADDGSEPYGSLILSGSTLYGMTQSGGNSNRGVIFSCTSYSEIYIFDGHDFNSDGVSDVSVFRPSNSFWYIKGVGNYKWGATGDKPASGDYDADCKTDVAVFRASAGKWYVRRSYNGATLTYLWGTNGDVPVPGNYDGDGKTDVAVWRPANGKWYVKGSAGTNMSISWGTNGDIPVPGDYDGDGKEDMAVFRTATGKWYIKGSSGTNYTYSWGQSGDIAVPADYDGDGKDDAAIFRAAAGKWYIQGSMGTNYTYSWGQSGDRAAPGYYDMDGKADVAIFRASLGKWMIKGSTGTNYTYTWGKNGDVPLVK
jgi:uncharacterized repeat protein (TIGR03803 family)